MFMDFSEHEEMIITQDLFDFEQYWLNIQDPMNACLFRSNKYETPCNLIYDFAF